jgi:iron complex outermembrane receptor protein
MRAIYRSLLLACVAPCALSGAAMAQDAAPAASNGLEEVVVTARRVQENLQAVPIAITAFTATELQEQQILNFGDIANNVPNLNLQTQFGEPATPFITIRGFSNGTLNPSVDSPIGLYVDDVYIGRAVGAAFDLADLEQLEVLRGPQGTLFGRNATGGALSFHTKKPTGEFDAHLETSFGDYGLKRVKATVDTPEVNGFAARLTVLHTENDGYVTNSAAGHSYVLPDPFGTITGANSFGENDETGVALAVSYTGIDKLRLDYKFDFTNQVQSQLATQALGFASTDSFQQTLVTNQGPANVPVSTSRLGSVPLGFESPGNLMVIGHSLTAAYDLTDTISLKNIVAYRTMREDTGGNEIDGGTYVGTPLTAATLGIPVGAPWTLIDGLARRAQHQTSEEFQVIGNMDWLSWIAGFYYFNEVGYQNDPIFSGFYGTGILTPSALAASVASPAAYQLGAIDGADNTSYAGYAHATAHVIDQVDLAAGVRYTNDQRVYDRYNPGSAVPILHDAPSFYHTDWDVSATYKFTPDISLYGKVATGYVAGGALGLYAFKPETNLSYEVGLKSEFLDRRLRFDLVGFSEHVKNEQVTEFAAPYGTYIINGNSETINGVELETRAIVLPGLQLTANFGYQRTPSTPDPITGEKSIALYPSENLALGAQYDTDPLFGDTYAAFRVDATWTSSHPNLEETLTTPQDLALQAATTTPAEWQVNLRASLIDIPVGPTKGKLSVWMKNALNNQNIAFAREIFFTVGQFEIPRTFGVDLALDFGGGEVAAPAETAAYTPPPAVAPTPSPKSYLVFFDFNKSDLTGQATAIVDQAAGNAGAAHVTQLTVTGHTDTVGSDAYNLRLSRRRAESVAERLEKDGIPSTEIEIVAKGKRDLLVPTGDGVKEPQNRRVQIVYSGGPTS